MMKYNLYTTEILKYSFCTTRMLKYSLCKTVTQSFMLPMNLICMYFSTFPISTYCTRRHTVVIRSTLLVRLPRNHISFSGRGKSLYPLWSLQTGFETHLALLLKGSFPRQGSEADKSPSYSSESASAWNYTSTTQYAPLTLTWITLPLYFLNCFVEITLVQPHNASSQI